MPATPRTRTRKPTARTAARAARPTAFTADDEPALPPDLDLDEDEEAPPPPRGDDKSIEAVEQRQNANFERGGYEGARFDPVTRQRVVSVPNGRGGHRKVLRPVRDKEEAQRTSVGDFYEPGVGWLRNGIKKETDVDARREDNLAED